MLTLMSRPLYIFTKVYDLGSVSAAGEAIGLTQPAVSKSLKLLEEQLDAHLFERTPYGVVPTPAADALRSRARWIERETELAKESLDKEQHMIGRQLTMGCNPVWSVLYLPDIIYRLNQTFPKTMLDVSVGSGDSLIPQVVDGELDLFFGVIPENFKHPNIHSTTVIPVDIVLYAREQHPIFKGNSSPKDKLWDYPWIAFSHHTDLDIHVQRFCEEADKPFPSFNIRVMSVLTLISVASRTDHIVFGVNIINSEMREKGFRKIDLNQTIHRFNTGMMVRESMIELKPIKLIIELIRHLSAV